MKKGFTLIELMVVILIVGILAAVAIPLMRGRIDSAKWSEGKAAMGTIATALCAYCVERVGDLSTPPLISSLGFASNDLDGTYFRSSDYTVTAVSYTASTGGLAYMITGTKANLVPSTMVLRNTGW